MGVTLTAAIGVTLTAAVGVTLTAAATLAAAVGAALMDGGREGMRVYAALRPAIRWVAVALSLALLGMPRAAEASWLHQISWGGRWELGAQGAFYDEEPP